MLQLDEAANLLLRQQTDNDELVEEYLQVRQVLDALLVELVVVFFWNSWLLHEHVDIAFEEGLGNRLEQQSDLHKLFVHVLLHQIIRALMLYLEVAVIHRDLEHLLFHWLAFAVT